MSSNGGGDWCTIESDPGVFTSLVESFGVKNVEFAELWGLEDDDLDRLARPDGSVEGAAGSVHGLIFLFKWVAGRERGGDDDDDAANDGQGTPLTGDDVPPGLFFAKQTTHNACATQAILSVLFNAPDSIAAEEGDEGEDGKGEGGGERGAEAPSTKDLDDDSGRRLVLGKTLSSFRSFTLHFPPDLRGEAIGSSDEIRSAHNSFGRPDDAFLSDPTKPKRTAGEDDDVYHFVAYVPHGDGGVYELDGLREGPARVGSYSPNSDGSGGGAGGGSWLRAARDAVRARLARHPPHEITFALMGVVQDRRTLLTSRLDALKDAGLDDADPSALEVRNELRGEEEKRARWERENARRRHNYLPFCVEYLRCLARSGKFEALTNRAKESAGEKRKRAEERKRTRGKG
ncbi:hypothetical protein ACHAWF_008482 [Thalassiosira exigua]